GEELNRAKEVLAFEATKICHGEGKALEAREVSRALFGKKGEMDWEAAPTAEMPLLQFRQGIPAYVLFEMVGLCVSKSDARRLIEQGGAYINGERVKAFDEQVGEERIQGGGLILRAGKKKYLRVVVV
ncbi:MAG: S4 domain-containing protein, partial [Desulfatiglandales bacterium]